jgi:hypothetical protein
LNGITASILFLILGVVFFITGIIMLYNAKKYFNGFYKDFRCYLWAATIFLTVPLFSRGVYDYFEIFNATFASWTDKNYVIANNSFVLFAGYVPIVT